MSDLDMSYLCRGWTPTQADPVSSVSLPRDLDLTLSLICANVTRNPYHPIRILTARAEGVDLWSVDLLISGELFIGEYHKPPKAFPALGGDRLQISLSYSPSSGGFALCANAMDGKEGVSMSASNIGRPPSLSATYALLVGADNMAPFPEVPPLGWIITAQFDLAAPIANSEPIGDWRLTESTWPTVRPGRGGGFVFGGEPLCDSIAVATAPSTNAMTSRTASRLVEANPHQTLELALNSIEHWLKVARSAMEEVP